MTVLLGTGRLEGPTTVVVDTADGQQRLEADVVLVAIGRVPYTDGLGSIKPASRPTTAAASSSTRTMPRT